MVFATGAFTTKPAFRLEVSANVIGWTTDPELFPGQTLAIVEVIAGIRRTSGTATDSGTGTVDVGNGSAGQINTFSYSFASTDYVQIYRHLWTRPITVTTDVWSATVTATTTLGTAAAMNSAMTYPAPTGATQPSFSPAIFNAGTSITVSLPRQVGTYTHDVLYSFGSINNSVLATGQGTSYTFTPALSLSTEIPNAVEAPYTITAITRTAAGAEVGRLSYTGTLRVPTSQAPTVSAYAASDTNTLVAAQVGAFVQTLSVLRLDSVTATGKQGATIVDRRLTIEGQDLALTGTRALFNAGTIPVTARAWDSRGYEGTLGGNVTVLAYSPPIVGVVLPAAPSGSVYRSTGAGVYDPNGQNIAFKLIGSVASLINGTEKNSFTVRISTRPIDSSTWTVRNTVTPTTTTSGGRINAASQTIVVGGGAIYLNDNSYVVRVEVYDKFNAVVQDTTIATSFVTIDMNGSSVGVGKLHERGAVDVAGSGYFRGLFNVIPTITNANNAADGGVYQIESSGSTNLPAGLPSGPYLIRVDRYVYSPGVETVLQSLSSYATPQRVSHIRLALASTGSSTATFDPWIAYGNSNSMSGLDAGRTSLPVNMVYDGLEYLSTDTGLRWTRLGGVWRLSPGQILASITYPASNVTGAVGTLIGSILSTPILPAGQRLKIFFNASVYSVAAGTNSISIRPRNSATNIAYTGTAGLNAAVRGYDAAAGAVHATVSPQYFMTTTTNAKVSAAAYLNSANTGLYGADVAQMWIESA